MTAQELRRKILQNSVSNYLRTGLRMVVGLWLFRVLYPKLWGLPGLTREEFGFYNLLWSIFGYGILMDFGFGLAAQKSVAELTHKKDWEGLSRALSSIFYFYFFSAIVIILIGIIGSPWLIEPIKLTNEVDREPFRQILMIFICYVGLSFPVGISVEILYGQQRIALANHLASIATVVNFALVYTAVHHHWHLKGIMILSLLNSLWPSALGGYLGLRHMPQVRLLPRYFSWSVLRKTMRFSIYAYIGTLTYLILSQTDRLILAVAVSVNAVTVYQTGAKVLDLFNGFTLQLPETISPAAAHLHAQGDRTALQRLIVEGTRFNVMLATPLYLLCALFMDGLMRLLTNGQNPDLPTLLCGEVLMLWGYSTIITHSISKKIFIMCGHERRLVVLSSIEAGANLVLSVALVLYFKSVVCVAIGSLIPTVIIGWFYLWPWAARDAGISGWELARRVLHGSWRGGLPVLAFGALCRWVPFLDFRDSTPKFTVLAAVAALLAVIGVWRWGLTRQEREKIGAKIAQMTGRPARKQPA